MVNPPACGPPWSIERSCNFLLSFPTLQDWPLLFPAPSPLSRFSRLECSPPVPSGKSPVLCYSRATLHFQRDPCGSSRELEFSIRNPPTLGQPLNYKRPASFPFSTRLPKSPRYAALLLFGPFPSASSPRVVVLEICLAGLGLVCGNGAVMASAWRLSPLLFFFEGVFFS